MTATSQPDHWLATGPVLARAADLILVEGHSVGDFHSSDGYCAAGAIGKVCDLDPEDWDDDTTHAPKARDFACGDDYDRARREWRQARAAALAALRTLAARIDPECDPAAMSRRELVEVVANWNDNDEDVEAEQVVAELRAAARDEVAA
jgi:hypothetical protein